MTTDVIILSKWLSFAGYFIHHILFFLRLSSFVYASERFFLGCSNREAMETPCLSLEVPDMAFSSLSVSSFNSLSAVSISSHALFPPVSRVLLQHTDPASYHPLPLPHWRGFFCTFSCSSVFFSSFPLLRFLHATAGHMLSGLTI